MITMLALPFSRIEAVGSIGVGVFVVMYWYLEQHWLGYRLNNIERQLAAQTGGELEDMEIRFRYEREYQYRQLHPFNLYMRYEPMLWLTAMTVVFTFNFVIQGRFAPLR
jgi:hypothetical protein